MLRWLRWEVGWRLLLLLCSWAEPALTLGRAVVMPSVETLTMVAERDVAVLQGAVALCSASRVRSALRPTPWPGSG